MLSDTLAAYFLSCQGCRNAENAESPLHIIMLHDRDIFTGDEGVIAEPVAGFIIVFIAVNVSSIPLVRHDGHSLLNLSA